MPKPRISTVEDAKPKMIDMQKPIEQEQYYSVTINALQLMWTVPLLTYTNSYTVISSKAP